MDLGGSIGETLLSQRTRDREIEENKRRNFARLLVDPDGRGRAILAHKLAQTLLATTTPSAEPGGRVAIFRYDTKFPLAIDGASAKYADRTLALRLRALTVGASFSEPAVDRQPWSAQVDLVLRDGDGESELPLGSTYDLDNIPDYALIDPSIIHDSDKVAILEEAARRLGVSVELVGTTNPVE